MRGRVEHLLRHFGCRDLAAAHGLVAHGLADELALGGLFRRQVLRAVAVALADAGGHKVRAQHAGADLVGNERQVLVQRFRQRHHGVLAHVVNAHVGRVQQASHAGRVDDVATPGGVGLGGGQHHGGEKAHAMHHAPQVHAQHPLPVFDGVLPHQAARAHTGVVEHQMGGAKALLHIGGQLLHLGGVRHIDLAGQHLAACGLHLGSGGVQRVLLHIHQHQVHAQARANAGTFQPKARACAGQHRRLAGKVVDHVFISLSLLLDVL